MKNRMRRLPRAATLLRVMALAVALTAAAVSHAQQGDIRINGGRLTANGGSEGGDAIGAGTSTNTITVYAAEMISVKVGDNATSTTNIAAGDITNSVKGKHYAKTEKGVCVNATGIYYATLQEAVDATDANQTITMMANSTENISIAAGKTITLDLNGKTITAQNAQSTVIANNGTLTLVDLLGVGNVTGGAEGVVQNGTLTVGGKLNITGNTANLYMPQGKVFTVGTGDKAPAEGMNIGITMATEATVNNPINITSSGSSTDLAYFHSDNANYSVICENNSATPAVSVLKLAIPVAQVGEGENAVYYSSINKALEHIGTEATTIKLLENTTEDIVITNQNVTLDLNGKTITSKSGGNAITVSGGSLTINDETENIGGVTGNIALNGGTTTINNGKYNGTITKNDAATLNLVGGKYSSDPTQFLTMDYAAKNIGEAPYLYEVVGGDEIVCNDGTHSFTSLQNAVNYQTAAATITMVKDDIENVTIANGKVITLDLNGKVLQGTGSGGVVTVEQGGNLTINDSDATAVHKFTPNAYGLWVLDETSGTKTVYGGCITGGNRSYGGGIYNHWILTLNGGNIVGNSAGSGGGIYTGQSNESGLNGSTLTINGGCIYGNIANSYGGGISVNGRCEVKLLGGEIRYNVGTYGGGVESGWQSTNPYTIGGSMVIADNKDFGANDNNLYVYNDYTFTVGTGDDAPKTGMNIGITAEKLASGKVITVSTANGTTDYSKYFTADAGTPFIVFADKKDDMKLKITDEVKIILTASPIDGGDVKIYDATTGLEIADPEHIQYGTLVTIKATQNKEWAFKGWFNNDGTMFSGKYEYTFEATENHTLEARFTNEVIWVRIKK